MLVKITGVTSDGDRFEFERELRSVPLLGDVVEYGGERYAVEARTEDNRAGEIIAGACRLKPPLKDLEAERCPKADFIAGATKRCINPVGHLGPCTFAP